MLILPWVYEYPINPLIGCVKAIENTKLVLLRKVIPFIPQERQHTHPILAQLSIKD